MLRLGIILFCAVVGFLLYLRGNRIYNQVVLGENAPGRRRIWAIGLTGLSAAVLFVGLILLMSLDSPEFTWTGPELNVVMAVAAIIGLVVAGVTAAKIYAFRRYGKRLFAAMDGQGEKVIDEPHQDDEGD